MVPVTDGDFALCHPGSSGSSRSNNLELSVGKRHQGRTKGVREALWDVDNAFLEVVHAAGLMNMGAQVSRDLELGRRAALASSSVLKGWLASYGLGLGTPEPRVLPT